MTTLCACLLFIQDASTAGKYLFVRDDDILVATPDGGEPVNITKNGKEIREEAPVWSPDGKRIAFLGGKGMTGDIYVVNSDGTGATKIAEAKGAENYKQPCWSPDGKKVACTVGFMGRSIAVVDLESGAVKKLTGEDIEVDTPAWSPDGRKISFILKKKGDLHGNLAVMNSDGSDLRKITDHDRSDANGAWSPDSVWIVFPSQGIKSREGNVTMMGGWDLFAIHPDGSGIRNLTQNSGKDESEGPCWSPDGSMIAFAGRRDGGPHRIFVMNVDGSKLHAVTEDQWGPSYNRVHWSPDGKTLLFVASWDELYAVQADGSNYRKLGRGMFASWSPAR